MGALEGPEAAFHFLNISNSSKFPFFLCQKKDIFKYAVITIWTNLSSAKKGHVQFQFQLQNGLLLFKHKAKGHCNGPYSGSTPFIGFVSTLCQHFELSDQSPALRAS